MAEIPPRKGSCFCGDVTYAVTGTPNLSAYCHCTLCQRLAAAPFIHTIHFSSSAFTWTNGSEARTDTYSVASRPWKTRYRCKRCGACVMSANERTDNRSVWGPHLERDEEGEIVAWEGIEPKAHMFYGTRLIPIADELEKWDGYPGKSQRLDV